MLRNVKKALVLRDYLAWTEKRRWDLGLWAWILSSPSQDWLIRIVKRVWNLVYRYKVSAYVEDVWVLSALTLKSGSSGAMGKIVYWETLNLCTFYVIL